MNRISNNIIKRIIPYLYVVVIAYGLNTLLFVFLPKQGVDFQGDLAISFPYKNYSNFYSTSSVNNTAVSQSRQVQKRAMETLSKYDLKAVYSTLSNGGWIIIQQKGSANSTILQQYDKFNGYTLTRLFKTYVIFEKNQEEYKLELEASEDMSYEIEKNTGASRERIMVEDGNVKIQRNYLNSYVNNLEKVWNNIAITDVKNGNKIEGFKIQRVNLNSVFGKLGLLKGDIIKKINGRKIDSYADAFKVYNDIGKIDLLTIEVLRNNEIVELSYEIN